MTSKNSLTKTTKWVFIAIVAGAIIGLILNLTSHAHLASFLAPLGELFIRLLKMVIVPLVLTSIFMAVVNLGSTQELGKLGAQTLIYFTTTTFIAVFLGIVVVNLIQPGVGLDLASLNPAALSTTLTNRINAGAEAGLFKTIINVFLDAIPSNPFQAMAEMQILQIIFFALLLGMVALANKKEALPVISLMESVEKLSMKLVQALMILAPVGVFALMVTTISTAGANAMVALLKYMAAVIIGIIIHFLLLLALAAIKLKKSPGFILQALAPALTTAFSTSSSAATLPVTLEVVENNLGIERKTAQFVLPLGATLNMDGTALYEAVAVIFIGQAYGIPMDFGTQFIIFITAAIAAVGAAAIPSAGLVTMSIVLTAVDFPLEGIGLIFAVDRILDMFRTTLNVFGDCVGSIVIQSLSTKSDNNAKQGAF
jgi:proton glutamate symport protein